MGFQVVVKADSQSAVETLLGDLASQCEIFPVEEGLIGVSIPTKILDAYGEGTINEKLKVRPFFDLWAGKWEHPIRG
ncbi:MAG: hypothetical protein K8T25_24685 [Planctomycetia bacterium]|nr:hypothetical protein [Planctomycetia bacterium]